MAAAHQLSRCQRNNIWLKGGIGIGSLSWRNAISAAYQASRISTSSHQAWQRCRHLYQRHIKYHRSTSRFLSRASTTTIS